MSRQRRREALAVVRLGEVGGHDDGVGEVGGERLEPVGPPGGDHDAGPDGVEHPGEAVAEARRGPGDDGDLAVEAEQGERVERRASWRRIVFRACSFRSGPTCR